MTSFFNFIYREFAQVYYPLIYCVVHLTLLVAYLTLSLGFGQINNHTSIVCLTMMVKYSTWNPIDLLCCVFDYVECSALNLKFGLLDVQSIRFIACLTEYHILS